VPLLGTLLKNKRAGETKLAWNLPALAGPAGITLRSTAFEPEGTIPQANAGKRAGGQNQSPQLSWAGVPAGTAQLLLVIQDVDAPTSVPFVHCAALLEPGLSELPAGTLNTGSGAVGVRLLRSGMGRGYLGPEPIKGHGPHRYVFQLFALASVAGDAAGLEEAKPRAVLAGFRGPTLARGRLDGFYTR
jgi:Raf kinase inhibitor-like YbhB/YbcL family protein